MLQCVVNVELARLISTDFVGARALTDVHMSPKKHLTFRSG